MTPGSQTSEYQLVKAAKSQSLSLGVLGLFLIAYALYVKQVDFAFAGLGLVACGALLHGLCVHGYAKSRATLKAAAEIKPAQHFHTHAAPHHQIPRGM